MGRLAEEAFLRESRDERGRVGRGGEEEDDFVLVGGRRWGCHDGLSFRIAVRGEKGRE